MGRWTRSVAVGVVGLMPVLASAGVPMMMNNQGVLRTAGGAPLADGQYDLTFRVYGSETATTPLWTETVTGVAVDDGFYSTVLGAKNPFPSDLFRNHPELWLGIRVGGGAELPRGRLLTIAYAFEADHAAEATAAGSAKTADFATVADSARTAESATTAGSAGEAETALTAGFATTATSAGVAEDLACFRCVSADELEPGFKGVAEDWARLVCYDSVAELRAALDQIYLPATGTIDTSLLPPGGLSAISNGTLSNFLDRQYLAPGLPAGIGTSRDVEIPVSDAGSVVDLTLSLAIEHSSVGELDVRLLPPGDPAGVRLVKPTGVPGGVLEETFTMQTQLPDGGTLVFLKGHDHAGTWVLRIQDTVQNGNEASGKVKFVSMTTRVLSSTQVNASADVSVAGDLSVDGTLSASGGVTSLGTMSAAGFMAGGTDLVAELNAARAELWCLKNCGPSVVGECRTGICDGTAQTCVPGAAAGDGTPCLGNVGRCRSGSCCIPATCHQLGACGTVSDGCGGQLQCGVCPAGAVCASGRCCVPRTCAYLGKECGTWDDGCGSLTPNCGQCSLPATCSPLGRCQ